MQGPLLDSISTCIDYIRQTCEASGLDSSFLTQDYETDFTDEVMSRLEYSEMAGFETALATVTDIESYWSVIATYATNYYTVLESLTLDVITDQYINVEV